MSDAGARHIDVEDIFARYGPSVLRRCHRMLGTSEDAEDAAQEVFVLLLRKGHSYRGDADLLHWIYRITTNLCLNRLRGHKRRVARETSNAASADTDSILARVEALYQSYAARDTVVGLLAGLDSVAQHIVVYRWLDGLTQEEIAEVMGLSRRTIGKKLKALESILAQVKP